MRLFIAVNLPKEVKDYLWELKEEFRDLGKLKFEPKKNYHITLKFLGEVEENKLDYIKQKLSNVKLNQFTTSLNKFGSFNYGVLWVDQEPKNNILQLAKKIDEQLIEYPNNYNFNDHITLARIKLLKDKKRFDELLKTSIKHLEIRVNSFELVKSELSKDGSRYSILESYSLE